MVKIILTKIIPFGFGAMALPGIIFIHPDRIPASERDATIAHEMVHVRQMGVGLKGWLNLPIYLVRYFLHKPTRARLEVEAYRETIRYYRSRGLALDINWLAHKIHSSYRFGGLGFGHWPSAGAIEAALR